MKTLSITQSHVWLILLALSIGISPLFGQRQTINCGGITYTVGMDSKVIITGTPTLSAVNYLTCENNLLIADMRDHNIFPRVLSGNSWIEIKRWFTTSSSTYYLTMDKKLYKVGNASPVHQDVQIIRSENDALFIEFANGTFKLLSGSSWIDIKQFITIGANSYFLKPDGSVSKIGSSSTIPGLTGVDYLVSNDKQLVARKGIAYWKLAGNSWVTFTPKFVPKNSSDELSMTDEGLWFFIQSRAAYDRRGDIGRRAGLTLDGSNNPVMETIPLRGNYDKFLWKLTSKGSGNYEITNKKGKTLELNSNKSFNFSLADKPVYGTTAYKIKQGGQSLTYNNGSPQLVADNTDIDQVWLLHFNQMQSEYMLQRSNTSNAAHKAQYCDRHLKGLYNTNFLATKTTSDWALVSAYFIHTNMILAVKDQDWIKGSANAGEGKGIDGLYAYIINKNDSDYQGAELLGDQTQFTSMAQFRGRADGNSNTLFITEELMCRVGQTHQFSQYYSLKGFSEFNQTVHEIFHVFENRLGPPNETFGSSVSNQTDFPFVKDAMALTNPQGGKIYPNYKISGPTRESESVAILGQNYFNAGRAYTYPGNRIEEALDANSTTLLAYLNTYFNPDNVWFPPTMLRSEFEGDLGIDIVDKPHSITSSSTNLTKENLILYSPNERFALQINGDGNLVIRDNVKELFVWNSYDDPAWTNPIRGSVQMKFENGKLKTTNPTWETTNNNNTGAKLVVDNSGKLMIISAEGYELFPEEETPPTPPAPSADPADYCKVGALVPDVGYVYSFDASANTGKVIYFEDLPKSTIQESQTSIRDLGVEWRLPGQTELMMVRDELHSKGIGDFKNERYRTGNQISNGYFNSLNFANGKLEADFIGNKTLIRPIRTITCDQITDLVNRQSETPNTSGLSIGDMHEGGIIFYLDETGNHGKVAAVQDIVSLPYFNARNEVNKMGDGWAIPSNKDLERMHANLHLAGKGNFSNEKYRSQESPRAWHTWSMHFSNKAMSSEPVGNKIRMRPVKSF